MKTPGGAAKKGFILDRNYPAQFWLIIAGLLISTFGTSLIWPFLTIYVSERLGLPLAEVAGLITLNGLIALFASFIAGPISDRLGRKWLMVVSLAGNGLTYFFLSQATTLLAFVILMSLRGFFQPLYRVGTNAMVTDLVPPEKRPDAFAVMRTSFNLGIAIGPAVGGFLAVTDYSVGFVVAAFTLLFFGLLIALFAQETMPRAGARTTQKAPGTTDRSPSRLGGYGQMVRDRKLMAFLASFILFKICSTMLWVLLAVYAKQNYGLPENRYGFIATTNALMVVLFQVSVTRITKRYRPLPVLSIGALIYALGVASVAMGSGFWSFWLSYVVATIGELMIAPTASTFVADLAPVDMRGRYMSSFSLSQGTGSAVGPLLGGLFNDLLGPRAIWIGGGIIGILGSAGFGLMGLREAKEEPEIDAAQQEPERVLS